MDDLNERLQALFCEDACCEAPLAVSGAGCRFTGLDLCQSLNPEQVGFLLDVLSQFRIITIVGQDLAHFSLAHFERFANHWGAPVPHPNNFLRGGKPAQSDSDSDGPFELIPFEQRSVAAVNATFPNQLQCLPHESPTVLVVANFRGEPTADNLAELTVSEGGSWHTDIEYEPLPIYVSMFLVHKAPHLRDAPGRSWVQIPDNRSTQPDFESSDCTLMRLRKSLPLNGETAFADTAAAFNALPLTEQTALERLQVRRRLNPEDEGWFAPLVRTNPRSAIKSLHSPIWASRPRVRPPIEVEGMSMQQSQAFLDRLEAHVLQPQFRYDHPHMPGDVTLWDNYMTLHNSPPVRSNINSIDDARLLYRLSCKGEPSLSLPRNDAPEWIETHIAGGYRSPSEMINIA